MGSGDGHAVFHPHQLCEHLRPWDHRDLTPPCVHYLLVGGTHGRRDDHHVGALHVRCRVPESHLPPQLLQPPRHSARRQVRSRHPITQIQEHFGDPAHPDPADADEVHLTDLLHVISSSTSSATRAV